MIEYYPALKLIHILSATILFGTGLGTAFSMWRADRSNNATVIAAVTKNVVLADWVFTSPAVLVQPISGLAMLHLSGISLTTSWVALSLLLYALVGLCWLPVVGLQLRAARLARIAAAAGRDLGADYHQTMRRWYALGWPAFAGVIGIFYLMVFKPHWW